MLKTALFIGGCNAQHVTLKLPGATQAGQIYRIPTAMFDPLSQFNGSDLASALGDAYSAVEEHDDVLKRMRYEASGRFTQTLTNTDFDAIIIDFWRDSYPSLIMLDGKLLSIGVELHDKPDLRRLLEKRFKRIQPGDRLYSRAFGRGLKSLSGIIASHQPHAKVILLDCPPTAISVRGGTMQDAKAYLGAEVYSGFYRDHYQRALKRYKSEISSSHICAFGDVTWTSPDAPWGEASLHYDMPFYERMAWKISQEILA